MARIPLDQSDALSYLYSIKQTFHDQPVIYEEFLKVIKDHRDLRISDADLIAKVQGMMRDHRKLLLGFTVFLPVGYTTKGLSQFQAIKTRVGKRVSSVLTMNDAFEFTRSVEEAFRDEAEKYKEFRKILLTKDTDIVKAEELLKDHPELFRLLGLFLSVESKIPFPPP